MARAKKIDRPAFEDIVKELSSQAEMIGTKQLTKQTVMDTFNGEVQAYRDGKISRRALRASVPRVNKELRGLDGETRAHIVNVEKVARRIALLVRRQHPKRFKATIKGVRRSELKKRRRTTARKRTTRRRRRRR